MLTIAMLAFLFPDDSPRRVRAPPRPNALCDYNHAFGPNLAEAWRHRGVAWFAKEDFTRAIADFDEALKLNPRLPGACGNRGEARVILGKPDGAEADLERCRALGGTLKPEAERLWHEARQKRAP